MSDFTALLARLPAVSPLPFDLATAPCLPLDLGAGNRDFDGVDAADAAAFGAWITAQLERSRARYAAGGYGEHRPLYAMSSVFSASPTGEAVAAPIAAEPRTVHLGIDLWLAAGTTVHAVLPGRVHSAQDNPAFGDYGPTLILEHEAGGERFHTLYGHLSRESLARTRAGQTVAAGEVIAWLGDATVNVGWPPHLHFQVIRDLGGRSGDYPGVCRGSERAQWLENCPDPNLLLRIPTLGRDEDVSTSG